MWVFTAGSDPQCRVFVNADNFRQIAHIRGRDFLEAAKPNEPHGIAAESFVLAGWPDDGGQPHFLGQFPDDAPHHNNLIAVQAAVQDALSREESVLDLEGLLAKMHTPGSK